MTQIEQVEYIKKKTFLMLKRIKSKSPPFIKISMLTHPRRWVNVPHFKGISCYIQYSNTYVCRISANIFAELLCSVQRARADLQTISHDFMLVVKFSSYIHCCKVQSALDVKKSE